jgi:TPR repeat protein
VSADDGPLCDSLAAHPYDPMRVGDGVDFEDLDVAAAETACRAAVAAHPDEPRYAYLLGRTLHVKEDYEGARQAYEAALAKGHVMAGFALGILYEYALGVPEDFGKAAALYRQAADGGAFIGLRNLAGMYESGSGVAQDYGEAARLYREGVDKGDPEAAIALGTLHEEGLGVAQDAAEAERLYRAAIAGTDRNASAGARNALAWMWARAGTNLEEGEALAAAAVAAYPQEAPFRDTLGWLRFRLGRAQAAAVELEQAVALDPDYAGYHDRLGDVYAELGRDDEAKAEWRRALDLPTPDRLFVPDWDAAANERKIVGAD